MKQDVDNKTMDMWDEECIRPTTKKDTYTFHADFVDSQNQEQRIYFDNLTLRQAQTLQSLFDAKFSRIYSTTQLTQMGWKLND